MAHREREAEEGRADDSSVASAPPGAPRFPWPTAVAIALGALLAQLPLHDRALVPMDEGHLATAAAWLLDGKLLYREIHTGIFPGIYLLTAGLFALFGEDLWVARLAAAVVNACIALVLWAISRRVVAVFWSLLVPAWYLALVVLAFPVLCMLNYSTLSVGFGLGALLFALRYREGGRVADAAALGVLVALAALTKQNFGGLVFVALLIGLLWTRGRGDAGERSIPSMLAPIAAAGLAPTLLVAGYFVATGSFGDFVDSTLISLGGSQMKDFNNPLPPILGEHPASDSRFVFLYTPPTLFNYMLHGQPLLGVPITPLVRSIAIRLSYGLPLAALALATAGLWLAAARIDDSRRAATRMVVVFAVLFFPGIFPSAIWSHLAFVLVPTLLVFGLLADGIDRFLRNSPRAGLAAAWRGFGAILTLASLVFCARMAYDITLWNPVALDLERASLRVSPRMAGLITGASDFVEACTAGDPDTPILAIPDIPAVYFVTGRSGVARYDLTIPGNVDGAEIVGRLESAATPCIVYNPVMYPEFQPFARLFPQLAHYIQSHYQRIGVIRGERSEWWGLERRGRAGDAGKEPKRS